MLGFQPFAGSIWDNFFLSDDMGEYRKWVKLHWDPIRRYEDVYDPYEKPETFSMTGDDLMKGRKKEGEEKDEDDDDEEHTRGETERGRWVVMNGLC